MSLVKSYRMQLKEEQELEFPDGSDVLNVGMIGNNLFVWVFDHEINNGHIHTKKFIICRDEKKFQYEKHNLIYHGSIIFQSSLFEGYGIVNILSGSNDELMIGHVFQVKE